MISLEGGYPASLPMIDDLVSVAGSSDRCCSCGRKGDAASENLVDPSDAPMNFGRSFERISVERRLTFLGPVSADLNAKEDFGGLCDL